MVMRRIGHTDLVAQVEDTIHVYTGDRYLSTFVPRLCQDSGCSDGAQLFHTLERMDQGKTTFQGQYHDLFCFHMAQYRMVCARGAKDDLSSASYFFRAKRASIRYRKSGAKVKSIRDMYGRWRDDIQLTERAVSILKQKLQEESRYEERETIPTYGDCYAYSSLDAYLSLIKR